MDITHNFKIAASPEKVYEAAATHKGITGWWCKNSEIGTEVGAISIMHFVKDGTPVDMHFRIDELQTDKRVLWTCVENGNPMWIDTVIRFEITKEADGTQLNFVHTFDDKWAENPMFAMIREGWVHFMDSFKSFCETGQGQPW
ncbi:MAG: SRPBCC family protein [Aurantibacter sp.]